VVRRRTRAEPLPSDLTASVSIRASLPVAHRLRAHGGGLARVVRLAGVTALLVLAACGRDSGGAAPVRLTVFAAGSLARPLRAALDSIAASGGPSVQLELMGSREIVRNLLALSRTPDLIVTADADELEAKLLPMHVMTSTTFARNRVVLALAPKLPGADTITAANWATVVASGRLRVARADPQRAPLGYRTQLVWQLTERASGRAGLADRLAAASPPALLRGNESDLAALLESGDADAAWCYESLARALRLKFVTLGDAIDLGAPAESLSYRRASVLIPGEQPGDTTVAVGAPIRYAIAVVTNGADVIGATLLRARLLDASSARIMRRYGLDVLPTPIVTTGRQKLNFAP
jgi:ABC-type molybdate transport system substrate-binding protein